MFFPKLRCVATDTVITVPGTATVNDAVRAMSHHGVRSVVVAQEGDLRVLRPSVLLQLDRLGANLETPLMALDLPRVSCLHQEDSVVDGLSALDAKLARKFDQLAGE